MMNIAVQRHAEMEGEVKPAHRTSQYSLGTRSYNTSPSKVARSKFLHTSLVMWLTMVWIFLPPHETPSQHRCCVGLQYHFAAVGDATEHGYFTRFNSTTSRYVLVLDPLATQTSISSLFQCMLCLSCSDSLIPYHSLISPPIFLSYLSFHSFLCFSLFSLSFSSYFLCSFTSHSFSFLFSLLAGWNFPSYLHLRKIFCVFEESNSRRDED